jgi:hypothetical protein
MRRSFKCIGSDINGESEADCWIWPSDAKYTLIHMTRSTLAGAEDVFGTMSVLSLSTGCQDTIADVLVRLSQRMDYGHLFQERTCTTGHW